MKVFRNLPILHIREFAVACIRWGLLFPTRLLWRAFWSEMCEPAALPRTIFEVPFTGIAWQTWITLTNYSTETHFIIWSLHSPIWELDCFDTGQPALALSCIEHPLLNFASENLRLGQERAVLDSGSRLGDLCCGIVKTKNPRSAWASEMSWND